MSADRFESTRRELLKAGVAGAFIAAAPAVAGAAEHGTEKPAAGAAAKGKEAVSPVMRTVATYITEALSKPLPDAIAEKTRHHLLDTIASMISGSHLVPGQKAIAYVQSLGGTEEACVPGSKIITNVVNAALAGGMLGHADETDDSHAASNMHPGCGIIPAALAIAEKKGASGTALLRATALGYDIGTRMGLALGAAAFQEAGHSSHTFGPMFGATAACAALAGLNYDQVRWALSYTCQQAAGLSNYPRDLEHVEKAFNFGGLPARNGAASVTMVASGMTGIDDSFSGDYNFFFAFRGPKTKPDELARELGKTYEVMNTNIKRWTVGSPMQAPLDSVHALIKEHKIKADDVEKVVVRIWPHGASTVNDRSMPDINLQYMVSVMLIDGTATLEAAHDFKRMNDPKVLELRKRVQLIADVDLEKFLPVKHGIVEMTLKDGRVLYHHTVDVRGTAKNPMTREEVDEKCYSLLLPIMGKQRARDLVNAVWRIDTTENVRSLRPLLMV